MKPFAVRRSWFSLTTIARSIRMIIPLLFLGFFLVYPLSAVLRLAFVDGAAGLRGLFADSYYVRLIGFTLGQATLSTLLVMGLGVPLAYVFARYDLPGKGLLRVLAMVPFVMPTVVVAAAFGALFGPQGVINVGLRAVAGPNVPQVAFNPGFGFVLVAHLFYNLPVVLRLVGGFWETLDRRIEESAAVLGASRWRIVREIVLPILLPPIGAAALLVFLFCFTSFGVILILGGPRMATIEVEIYRQIRDLLHLDSAAALAIVQLLCTLLVGLVYALLATRSAIPLDMRATPVAPRQPQTWRERLLVTGVALGMVLLLIAPLLALVIRSLLGPNGWTLTFYTTLGENRTHSIFFATPWQAILGSLRIALTTMLISLTLGLFTAYALVANPQRTRRNWLIILLDGMVTLPLGTSAVTLGVGFLLAFAVAPLQWLRTSPLLLPIAHSLLALPFVVRTLLPALRARDRRLREAGAVLGATPTRAWFLLELPLLLPTIVTAAAFAFVVSLGDFGVALLLARPETPTIPALIFRLLGQPGPLNYGQALALSTILMALTGAVFLVIEGRTGER